MATEGDRSPPPVSTWLGRLALAAAGVALVLAVGEGLARLTWPTPAALPDPDLPALTMADLGKSHLRGVFLGQLLRTNSRGLRGPEYAEKPPPGVFRIAIAGDSFVMGWGVAEEEAYPSVLAGLLNRDDAGRRFEVINGGLPGANTRVAMERLTAVAAAYRPQLLVYGVTINDIEGPAFEHHSPAAKKLQLFARYLRFSQSPSYLLRVLGPRWVYLQEKVAPTLRSRTEELRHNYLDNPRAWRDFTTGLDRLAALARERGVCGHVLLHTQLQDLGPDHPFHEVYDRIAAAATERGLSVTRSFPFFEGMRPSELIIAFHDIHPNPAGHALLAEALFDDLEKLPPRCWQQ